MASEPMNVDELVAFAELLADEARSILREANAAPTDVQYKADASPVTDLDRRIEAHIRTFIDDRYPEHGVLGEEHGSRDLDANLVWVLDPIDGTAPFIAGIPVYGTLIGLAHRGKPVLGIIDHPATDDRWVGIAGQATTRNGEAVRARRCGDLGAAFTTNSNPDFLTADERARFERVRSRVRYTQYGGSCYAYGLLASGRTDLALDGGLDIFDILAVVPVIEGAGGVVTDWAGEPIELGWQGRVLAAGDPALHREVLALLGAPTA